MSTSKMVTTIKDKGDQDELHVGEAKLREGDDKKDFTYTSTTNIKRMEDLSNRMVKKWTLKSGKIVENTSMQILRDNPKISFEKRGLPRRYSKRLVTIKQKN